MVAISYISSANCLFYFNACACVMRMYTRSGGGPKFILFFRLQSFSHFSFALFFFFLFFFFSFFLFFYIRHACPSYNRSSAKRCFGSAREFEWKKIYLLDCCTYTMMIRAQAMVAYRIFATICPTSTLSRNAQWICI